MPKSEQHLVKGTPVLVDLGLDGRRGGRVVGRVTWTHQESPPRYTVEYVQSNGATGKVVASHEAVTPLDLHSPEGVEHFLDA